MSSKKKQKQKPMSEAEYIETFCQEKRIHNRYAVYVSRETHALLMKVVGIFHDRYATAMSMADAILRHHFEQNRELLNRLYNEDMAASLSKHGDPQSESVYDDESD